MSIEVSLLPEVVTLAEIIDILVMLLHDVLGNRQGGNAAGSHEFVGRRVAAALAADAALGTRRGRGRRYRGLAVGAAVLGRRARLEVALQDLVAFRQVLLAELVHPEVQQGLASVAKKNKNNGP